ncbi:MAG: NPCBM/NEW2 domain-containing protein [Gaiellaceae bacterium]
MAKRIEGEMVTKIVLRIVGVTLTFTVALLAGMSLGPGSARAANPGATLGVYRGAANPSGVADFGSWLGGQVSYAEDFLPGDSWSALEAPTWWLNAWKGTGHRMVYGVPIIPGTGGSLAEGASGAYNGHFKTLAQNLVAAGQGDAILRLGWEFGGGWYAWAVKTTADASNYAAYWRQIVTTMKSVAPSLRFDWNPIWGWQQVDPALAYPGDAYVDTIGIDVYDQSWIPSYTDPVARWNDALTAQWGLQWHRDFAAAHGKPMSFPEWGLAIRSDGHGGGDAPYFIQQMAAWIAQNNVAYHIYFEVDVSDGQHMLTDSEFSQSSAAFTSLFGTGAAATPTTSTTTTTSTSTTTTTSTPTTTTTSTTPTTPSDTTPPAVTATLPAAGSSTVAPSASVFATFSEPLAASTVTASALKLKASGAATQVAATVSYDAASRTAKLTPTAPLSAGTTYVATVAGVKDLAGNPLASPVSWTFNTAAAGAAYLSDLAWVSATNGWGPVEKDKSNGGKAAGDGLTLTLNGVRYQKGLGTHAGSTVTYDLRGSAWKTFRSDVGIDDEEGTAGQVIFRVYIDGKKAYDSGTMTASTATKRVSVSVSGHRQLQLVVDSNGSIDSDHADWAGAQLAS